MASAANQKSMELEGNLSSFQLADVLKFLAMGHMTGRLVLENGQQSVVLLFREGMLIGSASADRDVSFGQLLVHGGHISRRQLQEALELQRERRGTQRLGRLLIERKLVERETLQNTLALQVKEELWEVFSWTAGTFRFEHDNQEEHGDTLLSLEVEPLIAEGAERLEQWRNISRNLGQLDEVYVCNAKLTGPPEKPLEPSTWRVLSLINGRLSLRGLIQLSGLGKFETLNALDRLLTAGLIEPRSTRPDAAASEATLGTMSAAVNAADSKRLPLAGRPEPIPQTAPAKAEVAESNETPAESGGGLRGLFGLRKRGAGGNGKNAPAEPSPKPAPMKQRAETAATGGPHLTGVGFACSLINRIALELGASRSGGSLAILGAPWADVLTRHPRTDLVRLLNGRLDASRFDRYAEIADGIDKTLAGCHEETMEALTAVARTLAQQARTSASHGPGWLKRTVDAALKDVEIRWPADFAPDAWTRQWMEE